ncbi:MAG TPA: bi-domain-containing oxidoreductase [Pyrinomonadaceae bacterium]|nr:bi-domain-containing oxidoreductase [Pyrinomonadaceae bacterium]
MKQILQNVRTGRVAVYDVPTPGVQRGRLLVRTAASLISAGTEKAAVDTGKKGLIGRARQRPDLVKQVIEKAKTDGLRNTYTAVKAKLDGTTALGYSASGIVAGVGEGIADFRVGDRVACAGAGYASHAEMISVPQNLCVRLPETIGFDAGAFGTLGAIALQGVRLAQPTLGEAVVVIGLGLLGQITVQLLKANGCRVFGVDLDAARMDIARELGAEACAPPVDAHAKIREWSRGRGADAVLITAATPSNDPIEVAGDVSRAKGRVVVVGLVGMDVPRNTYFLKELSLQISMSYGPGRYDPEYEERGHDYPFAYVRWTEGRNLEAFFDLVAEGRVDVERLISHRFPIDRGEDAYRLISGEVNEPYLGIVLEYDPPREITTPVHAPRKATGSSSVKIGLIGAGDYARAMLLPHFKANGAGFGSIASAAGLTALNVGRQFGFGSIVSTADEVICDEDTNLIVIATRHDSHASLARSALSAGKHVFVEKPLALNDDELSSVISAASDSRGCLMVGFNRRHSPAARAAREFFGGREFPLSILYRINAGRLPRTHWVQDPIEGGGRIVGEVCHFVDLMHFLTGSTVTRVFAESVRGRDQTATDDDSVFITLSFADGSNGSVAYLAEGDKSVSKERIEIHGGGQTVIIDDFRSISTHVDGRENQKQMRSANKGQAEQARVVCSFVQDGGEPPIPLADLAATTRATFRIVDSLREGVPMLI